MRRIATITAVLNLFGLGKSGFGASNPSAGILPTQFSATWCNDVQESICEVIEATAGAVPLGTSTADLLNAINWLITNQVGASAATLTALITALSASLAAGVVPAGSVSHFFGLTAPAGWLICNGQTIGNAASNANFADPSSSTLFGIIWDATINTTDGGAFQMLTAGGAPVARGLTAAADYALNYRIPLPDDRGLFRRGLDLGAGVDAGRVLATSQADAFGSHNHDVNNSEYNYTVQGGSNVIAGFPAGGTTVTTSSGGTETRPKNRAYLPIIKL